MRDGEEESGVREEQGEEEDSATVGINNK